MNSLASRKEFMLWPDLIRVVATFLVVTVHVSGQLTNVWGEISNGDWFIANIYGGIARICVPLFFMISGYLLLPRSESLGTFYRKRIPKILIPLIAWSLIYLGWYCGNHPGTCTPSMIQNLLFVQGAYYHLWFLFTLLGIYLILPVLRLMIRPETDRKILWYLIGLWLIFQSGLNFAYRFWGFRIKLSAPLATGLLGFFILGYLLGSWRLARSTVIFCVIAWILATLGTILGAYWMTQAGGKFDGFFYDFTTLNVILASASAFLLLRWVAETKIFSPPKAASSLRWLASGCFGIYLIHILVIEVLSGWIPGIHIDSFMGHPAWSIPLVVIIVFIISFLIVYLMQRIPVVKQIVPG